MIANIEFNEIDIEVDYNFEPEQRQTQDDPPIGAKVEVYEVWHKGEDITELISEDMKEKIEDYLLKSETK